MRELCFRWIERQRYEALKTARLLLLLTQSDQMIDTILDRLDVSVEHGGIGLQPRCLHFSLKLEPTIGIALVRADHRTRWLAKDLRATAGTRIQTCFDQFLN